MTDHANDPFCRPAPAHWDTKWLCVTTADDRVREVEGMDKLELERVFLLPRVQRVVLKAAQARHKKLMKAGLA